MPQQNSPMPPTVQQQKPASNKPIAEQPIQFQIPSVPLQMPSIPPGQPSQQEPASEEPKKKKGWKFWVIIIAIVIIIGGLGAYFLLG
ncbi:MAG: hypothetical protein NTW17_01975 [Candidatus Pacearchaeota archaeon]|nr:hypothetical protein [Candidatus Pacearchaeota archaeon]